MATVLDINAYGQTDIVEEKPEYPAEFVAWLRSEESRAVDTTLNEERAVALSFYRGEPFGNEEEGRSQVVTRDVAEVVDYMVISVMRTMVSGDRVVEFEALTDEDKDAVAQATEAVSQQFMREQDGYRVLHDSLKAGLLEKTGAVKTYVEEQRIRREAEVSDLELAALAEQGLELIEAEEVSPGAVDPLTGQEIEPARLRIAYVEKSPRFPDYPLPNEEFLVAKDARSLDEAVYYAHKVRKTVSEIREMGFTVDDVAFDAGTVADTTLSNARDDSASRYDDVRDGPNRLCWLNEEYVRYDLNGDGIAELLRVMRVGGQILSCEEIEYGLIEEWCPFPMQHRRVGQSLADKVLDIQLVRSVLLRQSLDNLYLSNSPRMLVPDSSMNDNTVDDLLTVRPGALVRYTGAQAPQPLVTPFVAAQSFEAMELLSGEKESRTGITRLNQGLDADALNKTATGTALMQAQGQQMEEYVARNFAEFMGRLFRKKYRLMKEYGRPFSIVVDGKPQMVDPSTWPDQIRVAVRVGLGSGRKEQRVQSRMLLLSIQKEAMAGGIGVTPEMLFNSVSGLVNDLNLGVATDYFPGPDTPQQEKPDPAQAEAQAKVQIAQVQVQGDLEKARIDAELKARQQEFDLEQKREAANLDAQLKRDRAAEEARLAQQKADRDWDLALLRLERETELAKMKADNDASLPASRPGGDLAE